MAKYYAITNDAGDQIKVDEFTGQLEIYEERKYAAQAYQHKIFNAERDFKISIVVVDAPREGVDCEQSK